jgi:hypothetical protein
MVINCFGIMLIMKLKHRRLIAVVVAFIGVITWLIINPASYESIFTRVDDNDQSVVATSDGEQADDLGDGSEGLLATDVLEKLEVKGRAPKTGYSREQFYKNWPMVDGCSLRQRVIRREFGEAAVVVDGCNVVAGEYDEPYTGQHLKYTEKTEISKGIQIDHVVALSDAWQKGAQYMEADVRYAMATDPLNLLAVDASANGKKLDGDAATWLPSNKKFRCQYVARQVSVKYKYKLWVTEAEKEAILRVLSNCPNELAVGV